MRLSFFRILCIIGIMLILLTLRQGASAGRAKRLVAFRKGSSFFYRLNYKIASIPSSTIFAQATGFKVAWKLPSSNMEKRNSRNAEEYNDSVELLYESHGFDGKACLAKNICQASEYINGKDGVMSKILKLIAKQSDFISLDGPTCRENSLRCPLELVGINSLIEGH